MKKIRFIYYFTICSLILVSLLGCQRNDPYKSTPLNFKLADSSPVEVTTDNTSSYKYRDVAYVFSDNKDEFLGLFYNALDINKSTYQFKIYPALYIINQTTDPKTKILSMHGIKIAEPQSGDQIFDATFNDSWIVWAESNQSIWKIYSLNRLTNEKILINQGSLLNKDEEDLPNLSLENNYLVYNYNKHDSSKLVYLNLDNQKSTDISKEDGGVIIGKAHINNDIIVWSENINGLWQVLAYHIQENTIKKISSLDTNSVDPYIWNNYVAWISYPNGQAQGDVDREMILYNLEKGKIEFQTKISKDISIYKPTISNGTLIWPKENNFDKSYQLYYYSTESMKSDSFENISSGIVTTSFENLRLMQNWLIWQPSILSIPPSPERTSQFIGTYFFPLKK